MAPLRSTSFLVLLILSTACDEKKASPSAGASSISAPPSSSSSVPSSTAALPSSAALSSAKPPVPDAITAQHVLVAWKGAKNAEKSVTRSKADARKRAEEVVTKAKGGVDFTALVNEYSDDPGSKARQGSVGKFTREKMTKPFSDAAFQLAVDEVSSVVETDFGYHVIKRNQ